MKIEGENINLVKFIYSAADGGTNVYPDGVAQESVLAYLMSKSADPVTGSFNNTTDSFEALSDKLGGFSGDGGAAQDDSVKASLDLVNTDTGKIYDATLGTDPVDGSLASFIATGGTALGTRLPASTSLYDVLLGNLATANRASGRPQIKATTIDLEQIAGTYTLMTGTTQDVIIESLLIRLPNVNVSNDATITSITIQTNDSEPQVFVNSVAGAKANLTAEVQIGWVGTALLKAGKLIQLTIAGGASDDPTVCDVVVKCRAVVSGGYLV